MENILNMITGPTSLGILGFLGAGMLFYVLRFIINLVFTKNNSERISEIIDNELDKLQHKDTETGKLARQKTKDLCNNIIKALDAEDGIN